MTIEKFKEFKKDLKRLFYLQRLKDYNSLSDNRGLKSEYIELKSKLNKEVDEL